MLHVLRRVIGDSEKMRVAMVSLAVMASFLAVPAIAAENPRPASDRDKMICKRDAEVGSIIKRRKTCMTKAEWDRVAESQQTGARKMIDELTTRPGGN